MRRQEMPVHRLAGTKWCAIHTGAKVEEAANKATRPASAEVQKFGQQARVACTMVARNITASCQLAKTVGAHLARRRQKIDEAL